MKVIAIACALAAASAAELTLHSQEATSVHATYGNIGFKSTEADGIKFYAVDTGAELERDHEDLTANIKAFSLALGEKGMTGVSHPATFGLHHQAAYTEDAEEDLEQEGASWGWRRRRRMVKGYGLMNCCGNNCFGRCGPGCHCWFLVCFSCGAHQGCYEHDCHCSCTGTWHPGCVSFMAHWNTCNYPGCAKFHCGNGHTVKCQKCYR